MNSEKKTLDNFQGKKDLILFQALDKLQKALSTINLVNSKYNDPCCQKVFCELYDLVDLQKICIVVDLVAVKNCIYKGNPENKYRLKITVVDRVKNTVQDIPLEDLVKVYMEILKQYH